MARSSGLVWATPPGELRAPDGLTYTVDRTGLVRFSGNSRRLEYHIGSGAAGQSYLYSYDGFLYQAPITWYALRRAWDASPGFEHDAHLRWNRPVDANCLFCHASQTRPIYNTQNRFAEPPFMQGGVACERCHGPGSDHIRGTSTMVNPAKLDAARRDSVCAQCHLSGEARIEKRDRSIAMYRPGQLLSDYVAYFVPETQVASAVKATGYVEKLAESLCKRASGDRLWCGSCHDPHEVPAPSEAAAYFRGKCLNCHKVTDCERGPDCRTCHMPRAKAIDGGHGVLTDHSIVRKPTSRSHETDWWRLTAFQGYEASVRELALAYAEVGVKRARTEQTREALRLLATLPPDKEILPRLADLYARTGDSSRAYQLYVQAARLAPTSPFVLVNLGALEAQRGNLSRAAELWRTALGMNAGLTEAALNLDRLIQMGISIPGAAEEVQKARLLEQGRIP